MAEAIIFEVNIQDSLSKLAGLREQLDDIKASQKNLDQAFKEGNIAADEYRKTSEALKIVTKNVSSEYRSAQRLLEGYTGAQKDNIDTTNFANNSVRQNRLLLKQLTEQYNDAKNPTAAFANQIKTLSDTLKKQEGAIGDTRRSVGNYKEGFVDAFKEISSGIPALGGFAKAQQGVNMVMAANPIGGVIQLLFGLKDILGGNAEVADLLTFAFDSVNKVFQSVIDLVVDGVKQLGFLKNAFSDPIGTIKELGSIIADNLLNRFKALGGFAESISLLFQGKFSEAAQKATNASLQLATGVQGLGDRFIEAGKSGFEASKQIDALVEAEGELALATAKNNKAIAEQKTILADKTKSDKERISAAKEIIRLEDLNAENAVKQAQKVLEAEKLKMKGKTKSAEDSKKLAELDANVTNAQIEATDGKRRAQVRLNDLLGKENTENVAKNLKDEAQQRAKYLADIAKLQDEFNLSERQKLEKSYTDKVNLIKGNNAQELALIDTINKAKEQALKKFDDDANKREDDLQKERIDKKRQRAIQTINESAALNQTLYENEVKRAELEIKNDEELAREKDRLALFNLERQLDTLKQLAAVDGDITDQELANIEKLKLAIRDLKEEASKPSERTLADAIGVSEEQQAQINEGLAVISQSVSAIGEVINSAYQVRLNDIEAVKNAEIAAINASGASAEEKTKKVQEAEKKAAMEAYEIQKKQFETNKTIAIIQTVINTAQAVMAQLANPTPYVGIVLAALAAATGAAQIAVIASQKPPAPPAFADGGKVLSGQMIGANDGKPIHRSNGDNLLATVKTGEVILNQRQQAALGGAATFRKIGVPGFAAGGLVGDGGFAARGMTRASEDRSFMTAAIRSGFATAPQPIVTVEEFNKVSTSSQRSVAVSEL